METAPTLESVFEALNALYRNPSPEGKEKASTWLEQLQHSVYAWQIADQLLQLNHDVESCYFAAHTMRTKIQYAFHELPQDSHQALRDSLLNHAAKITQDSPPVIATQLCLALADLSLQMATWQGATQDLVSRFSTDAKHLHFLVELLTVLPEEINSRSLRLGENRRQEFMRELTTAAPTVLQLLTACLESAGSDARLQAKVFRCLSSWFSVQAIQQDHMIQSPLLGAPFQALVNPECPSHLHEAAADSVCAALRAVELRGQEDLPDKSQLALGLFQGVLILPDAYHMSVAMEDTDKSLNYCRIFTELAESFIDMIVLSPNQGFGDLRTLELLLTCAGHHQYEVIVITFNFWYQLSESLYRIDNKQLNEIFVPYYNRLILSLCRHCQYDPDHEGIPNDSDEFGDFRQRASELIFDVVFVVGSTTCFKQMFQNLKQQSPDSSWDASEAALFVMTAVAKNILSEENEVVPQVLDAVLGLPEGTHIALRHTGISLIGELCEWIEHHPEVLDGVLQFLLAGLQQDPLASAAARALQSICSHCQDHIVHHFPGLLQIVQAMDSFQLSADAGVGLLKGACQVLAKMPPDEIREGIKQLAQLQLTPLQALLLQHDGTEPKSGSGKDPSLWLDRLAAIFRDMQISVPPGIEHPCQEAVQLVWPVVSKTCTLYQRSARIIERCCRCIRFLVRCLGYSSAWLLDPLVAQMIELYTAHHHSCYLYLGSILVDEYGRWRTCIPGLLDMLSALAMPAFRLLEGKNGLRDNPDTVDDLVRLCLRFVQRAPVPFLKSDMIKPVLACVIAACSLDHSDANNSVVKFLLEFLRCSREREDQENFAERSQLARALIEEHGEQLVQELLKACLFSLRRHMIYDMSEVLYYLMLVDRPQVCRWLETALKGLPQENSSGLVSATNKQLTDFHKAVTTAEEDKAVSRAIRELARLYR